MTIAVILPITSKWMVIVTMRQWLVCCEQLNHCHQAHVQGSMMPRLFLTLIIALELIAIINLPHHSNSPRDYQHCPLLPLRRDAQLSLLQSSLYWLSVVQKATLFP